MWGILAIALIVGIAVGIGLYSYFKADNSVAATLNGEDILESTITNRIMLMRDANSSYADDATWATALSYSDLTPEKLREQVIKSEAWSIITKELAQDMGLTVDEEAIDLNIEQAKITIGGDAQDWLSSLKRHGYLSEADYRNELIVGDLQAQILEIKKFEPTSQELEDYVLSLISYYTGKRSSAIQLQPTEEQTQEDIDAIAAEIMQKLEEGTAFADLAREYSTDEETASEGGDMNWEAMAYLDEAYLEVLHALNVGETSEPFTTEDGITYIIACTDEFTADEDGNIAFNSVPADIVEVFRDYWVSTNQTTKFQEYIEDLLDKADFVIFPMPQNVPYNVDMSLAQEIPDNEEEPEDYSASSPEAVEAAIAAGLVIQDVEMGAGDTAEPGSTVTVQYTGVFEDGVIFDSGEISFVLGRGEVIAGWDAGIVNMQVGGIRQLIIPPALGYGNEDYSSIPGGSTLYFDVELVSVTPRS